MSYWIIDNTTADFNSKFDKKLPTFYYEPNDLVYCHLDVVKHEHKIGYMEFFRIIDEIIDDIDCASAGETMFDVLITFRCVSEDGSDVKD